MDLLDSRRLRNFLAVYDVGSIGQAAQKLFLTQPALSKSIRQLEEDLQVQLFERTPTGVIPTVFGDALAQHAKIIRAEMRNAEHEIAILRGAAKGQVRIGVGPSVATNILPHALLELHKTHPNIMITAREGLVDELIPAVRRGELDLAIGSWPQVSDPDLAADIILSDKVSVVAGKNHPLAKQTSVELTQLLNYPWALPPETQRWRRLLEETFIAQGITPPRADVTSNSSTLIWSLLMGNDFLSFLPEQVLPDDKDSGLVTLPVKALSLDIHVTATYRSRAMLSPATQALIKAVKNAVEKR
ncbi:MAG: LysR family transcriptional regulator [Gammaproteobacteria bacterium]|nr:LysR family transcriptional regulator [Gammaproteobacteria bacterium]